MFTVATSYAQSGCLNSSTITTAQWNAWQQQQQISSQNAIWTSCSTNTFSYYFDQQQAYVQSLAGLNAQQDFSGLNGQLGLAGQLGQLGQGLQQWTEEDRQRYAQAQQQAQEEQQKAREDRDKAEQTARNTLLEVLDDGQKDTLEKEGCFYLRTEGHRYRIKPGQSVERVDEQGRITSRFCIHAPYSYKLPPSDQAICHKLMLECEPDYFFKTANETRVAA